MIAAATRQPQPILRLAGVGSMLVLLAIVAIGCDDPGDGELRIATTTSVARSIVEQVAGPGAEVTQIVPDDAAPHSYAPSAADQRALAEADLLVYFSDSFETALPIETADRAFAIDEHTGELREFSGGGEDPHVWMDPTRIAEALPTLADELAAIDPRGAAGYRRRAEDLAARLDRLDRRLAAIAARVPEQSRILVSSHESLGYFADRYGYEYVGTLFGASPEAQASPRDAAELMRAVLGRDVGAVFAQRGEPVGVLDRFAKGSYEVVDDLSVEQLGPGIGTYEQMMKATARRIAEALGG